MALDIVAIIGSPNVGKSTLFNRFLGMRRAIINDEPGVTRDRLYETTSWLNKKFRLIDTGGIEISKAPFQEQIRIQAEIAILEAEIIVFVVDGQTGLTNDDLQISRLLKNANKKVILVVNKIDDITKIGDAYHFSSLGFGEPFVVSGEHGIGIGDLLDHIVFLLPESKEEKYSEDKIIFSLIGRPNVGKSSLFNAILGQKRVIVSNIPGTTRDAIDTSFNVGDSNYVAIDTAGLKRKGKIYEALDKYSAMRALDAIERSEIVLLVIDAKEGIIEQDKHILNRAIELHKAIILIVNKWDLIDQRFISMDEFRMQIKKEFKFLEFAPIVFVSALTHFQVDQILPLIDVVFNAYQTRIQTSILNEIIHDAQLMNPPPLFQGQRLKIYFVNQVDVRPPSFVFFVNHKRHAHFSYVRYLENRLRQSYNFEGTPLKFIFREKA